MSVDEQGVASSLGLASVGRVPQGRTPSETTWVSCGRPVHSQTTRLEDSKASSSQGRRLSPTLAARSCRLSITRLIALQANPKELRPFPPRLSRRGDLQEGDSAFLWVGQPSDREGDSLLLASTGRFSPAEKKSVPFRAGPAGCCGMNSVPFSPRPRRRGQSIFAEAAAVPPRRGQSPGAS